MPYSADDSAKLKREADVIVAQMNILVDDVMLGRWHRLTKPGAVLYMKEGVCRRVGMIRHTLERIFEIFPPERSTVLERTDRMDVQAFLHAFVMNVYGALDNLAWVFVLEQDLMPLLRDRRRVGLFHPATQAHLPATFRTYLSSEKLIAWFQTYAKNYRDALAHRLPPYVPPFVLIEANSRQYHELEEAMNAALLAGDFATIEVLEREQKLLTLPAAHFLLSMADEDGRDPLQLQPQLIVDAMTVHDIARRLGAEFSSAP